MVKLISAKVHAVKICTKNFLVWFASHNEPCEHTRVGHRYSIPTLANSLSVSGFVTYLKDL